MKGTRNVFSLIGPQKKVELAMEELQSNEMEVLKFGEATKKRIMEAFSNNKSVLCEGKVPSEFYDKAIFICVLEFDEEFTFPTKIPYINLNGSVKEQFQKIVSESRM